MYLARVTRDDIQYDVNQLARAMAVPSMPHMAVAKRLLRYLAGSIDHNKCFKKGGFHLRAFSDANWSNNPDNSKWLHHTSSRWRRPSLASKSGYKPNRTINDGSGTSCRNTHHEWGVFLLEHDYWDGVWFIFQHCTDLSRQHNDSPGDCQPYFQWKDERHLIVSFVMRELVESEKITVQYIERENRVADIGIELLLTQRSRHLVNLIKNFNN